MKDTTILSMNHITKIYGNGIMANEDVTLSVREGEIHALMGENGAGKSTLMKVLFGIEKPDGGEILLNGRPVQITNPTVALSFGIGMVHQHFMLVPSLTVAENLVLGSEPKKGIVLDYALWMTLLGGYVNSGGQIIEPDTDWVGTGIFAWPLPQSFTITSPFGYRKDPFTGEVTYHSGTDIAAPAGTPILAAAAGMVTIANGADPWGGSYGYYIKLDHGGGIETLYAHCSAITVTAGQRVRQGEVIGYVGTTGNSTGNHLHFEVWENGKCKNALDYYVC